LKNGSWHTALLFSLLLGGTSALGSETFNIGVINWCPYICPDTPKKPGILVEYIQAIYEDTGYQIKMDVYPWSRAIVYAIDGTSDALLAPSKNEAPDLVFPNTEILSQKMCFFTAMDNPWQYVDSQSLTGKRVTYPQDALPEGLNKLNKQTTFVAKAYSKTFLSQVTSMVQSHRIDIVLADYFAMSGYLNMNGLTRNIKLSGCLPSEKIYLAFTPNVDNKNRIKHLVEIYEERIKVLIKNEFLKGLLTKYQLH